MKSILVPTGGGDSDGPVFETALAAARLFSAHLRFVHIRLSPGQAAAHTPHVAFASGPALSSALAVLETDADLRSTGAVQHVHDFCVRSLIDILDTPSNSTGVTASFHKEENDASRRLMFYARHSDLVVMGRPKCPNGLPSDLIEELLVGCGHPILLASLTPPRDLTGTIMVCWRETADAARAVAASTPFLAKAKRVVFVGVAEHNNVIADAVGDLAAQFKWHGVATDVQIVVPSGRPISDVLSSTAEACSADLMVMGAYGHSRTRELIFGGLHASCNPPRRPAGAVIALIGRGWSRNCAGPADCVAVLVGAVTRLTPKPRYDHLNRPNECPSVGCILAFLI